MPNPLISPIRQAMASGQFPLAGRLWNGYAAQLTEQLRRGSLTAVALEEARELVEWSRRTVLSMRAQAQGRLSSLHVAGVYDSAPSSASPRIIRTGL
jgi:hypothetical protein